MLIQDLLPEFHATSHRDGSCNVVHFTGELDLANERLAQLEIEIALDRGGDELVVDLRELTFLDVRGAHLLLDLPALCRARGQRLRILTAPAPAPVLRVLGLCGARSELLLDELDDQRPL